MPPKTDILYPYVLLSLMGMGEQRQTDSADTHKTNISIFPLTSCLHTHIHTQMHVFAPIIIFSHMCDMMHDHEFKRRMVRPPGLIRLLSASSYLLTAAAWQRLVIDLTAPLKKRR